MKKQASIFAAMDSLVQVGTNEQQTHSVATGRRTTPIQALKREGPGRPVTGKVQLTIKLPPELLKVLDSEVARLKEEGTLPRSKCNISALIEEFAWFALEHSNEKAKLSSTIARGRQALREGHVVDQAEAERRLSKY